MIDAGAVVDDRDDPAARRRGSSLAVNDLAVAFRIGGRMVPVVRGVSFGVEAGRTTALVGESGSGKSVSALSILRLAGGRKNRLVTGRVSLRRGDGTVSDLLHLGDRDMQAVRGGEIGVVFQEPMTALNPVMRIGHQITEALLAHGATTRASAAKRALEMLTKVGIPEPAARFDAYPHQLSGGMRQRVMIAMALACDPAMVIADEPTTALDVTIQAQILALLRSMQRDLGTGILLITHDLGVVAENADRVIVMYAGTVMEDGPTRTVLDRPGHPYTRALLGSIPRYVARGRRLSALGGSVASPGALPSGCVFHPRCPHAVPGRCDVAEPVLEQAEPGHLIRCVRWREIGEEPTR